MPLKPFDAPRLKLWRARSHIGELTDQMRAYLNRAPFHLEIVNAPTFTNGKKWVVRVREEVPADFSAIVGDVIHNLRTSLDLLACELVRANGRSDNGVYFPFAESAADLPRMIRKRHMNRAKPEVVALIEESQPYIGGNRALRAIHDLDIMDKHQALIPTLDMVGAPDVPGFETPQGHRFGPIREGVGLATLGDHARLPIGLQSRGEFALRFDAIHYAVSGMVVFPLGGGEVVPTLISLANLVESLIEAFVLVA